MQVADEAALGEEVRRQLHGAAEAGADHGGPDAAVQARDALGAVDARESRPRVAVVVLRADGQKGRVRLQPRLDEEEGRARGRAEHAGRGADEDVHAERLRVRAAEDGRRDGAPDRLVESEAAAVEGHLVDVLLEVRRVVHEGEVRGLPRTRYPGVARERPRSCI